MKEIKIRKKNEASKVKKSKKRSRTEDGMDVDAAEQTNSKIEVDDIEDDDVPVQTAETTKKKREKIIQRSEASETISEFNLTEVGKEKVKLHDLIKTLKNTTSHTAIKQQLKKAGKKKTLPVPLDKQQAEKIKRTIAYGKVREEVSKWDQVVQTNRLADQIIYPLKQPEFRLETTEEVCKRFQTKNALEAEVAKLLNSSENVLDQKKALTAAEEKALQAMNLDEAKKRHAELQKMRVLLSYKEAKARRQNKIKSKKYHRILKKERMRKIMKDFEELKQTDPEAAEEKLLEADKLRILERVTLKHKSTGKWAKQQKLRAKYNPESRVALKEQTSLSRQLTEKVPVNEILKDQQKSADSVICNDDDDVLNLYNISSHLDLTAKEAIVTNSQPKKIEQLLKVKKTIEKEVDPVQSDIANEEEDDVEDLIDETVERKRTMDDFENLPDLDSVTSKDLKVPKPSASLKLVEMAKAKPNPPVVYVHETDFSETKFLEKSAVPDDITFGDEDIDDTNRDTMNIEQAFADEDFIAEFREDKKDLVRREKLQGIDLFLPGWGTWGGTGIIPSNKKRRRFYIKPIDAPLRKDHTLGNVIINEDKDKKASVHQVNNVPFPYSSVQQFESIIRQPIGNTWNTETGFRKLIAPKVITKMGKIIEPIDADSVILQKEVKQKKVYVKRNQNQNNRSKLKKKENFKKK